MRRPLLAGLGALGLAGLVGGAWLALRDSRSSAELLLTYELTPRAAESQQQAERALRRTEVELRRRARQLVPRARLSRRGNRLVLRLPPLAPDELETFKRRLLQQAQLALRLVDDSPGYVPQLVRLAALPAGVRLKRNSYAHPAGGRASYVTLVSGRRQALADYLRQLPPRLRPSADRELVLGESLGPFGRQTLYELYVLWRRVELSADQLQRVALDGGRGQPELVLTLTAAGARRLARLSRRQRGRRLALVLDGVVRAAPVLDRPLSGRQVRLELGGYRDARTRRAELRELEQLLAARPLPMQVRLLPPASGRLP